MKEHPMRIVILMLVALSAMNGAINVALAESTPDGHNAAKADKGVKDYAKADKGVKDYAKAAGKVKHTPLLSPQMLGKVLGQPLSAEQEVALEYAAQAYMQSAAKAVGLTAEGLEAKLNEYWGAEKKHLGEANTKEYYDAEKKHKGEANTKEYWGAEKKHKSEVKPEKVKSDAGAQ